MSKMYIETIEVGGIVTAMYGMRNPMNSWELSDSKMSCDGDFNEHPVIGERDMKLARKLSKAGSEHAKYLRQIQVWANVNMPRYWWSEADTYKFGTKSSCSTMHKLFNTKNAICLDDFVFSNKDRELMNIIVDNLNTIREEWIFWKELKNQLKMDECLIRAKRILPEGFLQLRTWNTNYAELMNMYQQRKHHRLKEEWVDVFCSWCETLPYFYELCIDI